MNTYKRVVFLFLVLSANILNGMNEKQNDYIEKVPDDILKEIVLFCSPDEQINLITSNLSNFSKNLFLFIQDYIRAIVFNAPTIDLF